jgi:hypothetical protein
MMDRIALSHWPIAEGDRLSDAHLGLLLDALQLGTTLTEDPERFRRAVAMVASHSRQLACVA